MCIRDRSDGKLIYYKCMALRAKKFRETINGFSSNYNGQTFHTMDEFCDFLEDNKMTFRLDYSNYYFLKVDGVGDEMCIRDSSNKVQLFLTGLEYSQTIN